MITQRPPRLARLLAAVILRGEMREVVLGDLDEEFARTVTDGGSIRAARRHYWRQAVASILAVWPRSAPAMADRQHPMPRPRGFFGGWGSDLRQSVRGLAQTPGFTAVAALSVGIGVGANTAVYNIIRVMLFEPLPVDRPQELALVYWAGPKEGKVRTTQLNSSGYLDRSTNQHYRSNFTYPMYAAIREASGDPRAVFGYNVLQRLNVSAGDRPPVVASGLLVSGNYFAAMELQTVLGRPLSEADDQMNAPPVVVLSDGFWTRVLGADPRVIGRTLRINGAVFEIVGVTKPGYRGLSQSGFFPSTDLTVPLSAQPLVMPRWSAMPAAGASLFTSDLFWVRIMGRFPEPTAEAQEAMTAVLRDHYMRLPLADATQAQHAAVRVLPGARGLDSLRVEAERPLLLLGGVVALVLLIACLNLAGLILSRGMSRQRDLAIRRALGAGRWRLIRAMMCESLLLALLGGAIGLLLATWSGPVITRMLTIGLGAGELDLGADWTLVGTAVGISIVAALLAGLLPAVRLSGSFATSLTQRADGAASRQFTSRALIAAQIAVSVPLLVGAILLLRSVHNLNEAPLGFDPSGLVMFRVEPPAGSGVRRADPIAAYERLLERAARLPGVRSTTLVENPLIGGRTSNTNVFIGGTPTSMDMNAVGPDFFKTMGIPIVAGRPIGVEDRPGRVPALVINESAAATYFPGESPLGRRMTIGLRDVEIVGVAADSLYSSLRKEPEPAFYDAFGQRAGAMPTIERMTGSSAPLSMQIVLRTDAPAATLERLIPAAMAEVDPEMVVTGIRTQLDQINSSIARERMFTRLLVLFGGFAMLLACIGLYGVTSYAVSRRTSEIGIRLALGAQRPQVLWLVLRQVMLLAVLGVLIGVPIAFAAGPVVASLMFGLAPRDTLTLALAALAMLTVAIAAGWLPARRAARISVLAALRHE